MGVLDPIAQALSQPGPVTDRSTHTTTQLPPYPMERGAIHTNQKKPQTETFDLLRSGKGGPKPY